MQHTKTFYCPASLQTLSTTTQLYSSNSWLGSISAVAAYGGLEGAAVGSAGVHSKLMQQAAARGARALEIAWICSPRPAAAHHIVSQRVQRMTTHPAPHSHGHAGPCPAATVALSGCVAQTLAYIRSSQQCSTSTCSTCCARHLCLLSVSVAVLDFCPAAAVHPFEVVQEMGHQLGNMAMLYVLIGLLNKRARKAGDNAARQVGRTQHRVAGDCAVAVAGRGGTAVCVRTEPVQCSCSWHGCSSVRDASGASYPLKVAAVSSVGQ